MPRRLSCHSLDSARNDTQNVRSVAFTSALQLLTLVCPCSEAGEGSRAVTVRVRCPHTSVELVGRGVPSPPRRGPPRDYGEDGDGDESMLTLLWRVAFSDDERAIVTVLTDGPLAAPAISRKLHESTDGPSTRLKTLLANLCDRGVLDLGRDGYAVSDPRLLDVARQSEPGAGSSASPPG